MNTTCLVVIDGWGLDSNEHGNAVAGAKTPCMTRLAKEFPTISLSASGLDVGLPDGLMGNSEVGHLNIGAGRVVYQDIVRIELAIKNSTLCLESAVVKAFDRARNGNGRLHLLGLLSDGGVHSHINHLLALLKGAKDAGVPNTFIQAFGDGRDTAPKSAQGYLTTLTEFIQEINYGELASLTGRYYAMDRDKRWERIKVAYDGLVQGIGETSSDVFQTLQDRYTKEETDGMYISLRLEFLKPIILGSNGRIQDGDTLLFFNYRSDRMREINQALGIAPIPFETEKIPNDISITTMTQFKSDFPFDVIFPPQVMTNVLAEWLSKLNIRQSHQAETEKFAHVTFFFNGGIEAKYPLEDRELIQSPKVATYDLEPQMSAIQVGQKVAETILGGEYPFVMCNFAPPDMVGHTGVYDAAVKGVEATDTAIGLIFEACQKTGTTLFVTADHGNAEKMFGDNGQPHTAHTTNPVPFIMTSKSHSFKAKPNAALCDVAPTILKVMGLEIPKEMTGESLIK